MEDLQHQDNEIDQEEDEQPSGGLADVMTKILRSTKPKKKKGKCIILSRAKKDFQLTTDESSVRERDEDSSAPERPKKRLKRKECQLENLNRVKPNPVEDIQLERQLVRIATKGVVQLFNAVSSRPGSRNLGLKSKSGVIKNEYD